MSNLCVKLAPATQRIATLGANSVYPLDALVLVSDPTCSSGLVISDTSAPIDATRVQDMSIVFGLALAALAGVWGIKQLIKLFDSDFEK